jgi:hypothetical protein
MPRSPLKMVCKWRIPKQEAIARIRKRGGPLLKKHRKLPTIEAQARKEYRSCQWKCVGPVRAAMFVEKRRPGSYAILHPSTKEPGTWQVSLFDKDGPWGDRPRATCNEAVAELEPWEYRLKEVH